MKKRVIYALILVSIIVLLDQSTKYLARTYIYPDETIKVMPALNLVNIRNEGAAFGMFRSFGNTFFIVISFVAITFISWVIVTGKEDYEMFPFLAGGALGNLTDRLTLGYVVDFIDISVSGYHWPAFNVADSALTVGIFLILFRLVTKRH